MTTEKTIELGDRVRDVVSGLEGIATARTVWLNGCVRWSIDAPAVDGKIPEALWADQQQVKFVERDPCGFYPEPIEPDEDATEPIRSTGGPTRSSDRLPAGG